MPRKTMTAAEFSDFVFSIPFENKTKQRSRQRVTMPPYDHDCEKCQWVGWYTAPGALTPVNIYLHEDNGVKTIVIREGDRQEQYVSYRVGALEKGPIEL